MDSELSFTSRPLPPSLAFVSLGDWSNGASRSLDSLPEKPGKEIEDNPGFHAGDKLILEKEEGRGEVRRPSSFQSKPSEREPV